MLQNLTLVFFGKGGTAMWAVLAVILFLAAQVYLLRSLKNVDGFFAHQQENEEREILSLVFADPAMAESMAHLLAEFSHENPEIEMVLHTDPAVPDAVWEGRAVVGFLAESSELFHGLSSCTFEYAGLSSRQVVWKTGVQPDCAAAFLRYLRQSGGNPAETVV